MINTVISLSASLAFPHVYPWLKGKSTAGPLCRGGLRGSRAAHGHRGRQGGPNVDFSPIIGGTTLW